jgi:hypothetical protein
VTRAAVLFLLLAVVHTWPLATAPHALSLNHNADAQLNAWIVSWVAHTIPTAPWDLWRGNIFQPGEAAWTLSEPLLVPGLAAAPLWWLTRNPVLLFNVLLISGLAASGWCAWWVLRRWTKNPEAALIGGALVVFNAHVLTRLPHLQAAHAWGLPLVWWWTWQMARGDRRWWALALAVGATAATSFHWLLFGAAGAVLLALFTVRDWRAFVRLSGGSLAGIVLAAPAVWPQLADTIERPLDQVADFSATLTGWVSSMSRVHGGWTAPWFTADTNVFFPGVTAIVLAAVGFWPTREHEPLAPVLRRWAVSLVVVGVLLSLGTSTPLYGWLYDLVPPMRGVRAAARFGMLALCGLAILAALGTTRLLARRSPRSRGTLTAALLLCVTAEQWLGPIRTTPFSGIPPIYDRLRDDGGRVLLVEAPFYPGEAAFENGEYILNATGHWHDVMNGYSGVAPMSYRTHAESFWFFPESWAVDAIRAAGATHVMVHLERFGPEAAAVSEILGNRQDLRLMAADRQGHRLYRVVPVRE